MGPLVSKAQYEKVLGYIQRGEKEGAKLLMGGTRSGNPALANGFFIEPTVFGDVQVGMAIAQEEIFGPVLCAFRWNSEDQLFAAVNSVDYGLTASLWTSSLSTAHRAAAKVQAGYVWVNNSSQHFLGAPFGGYKQSGIGREECFEELLEFTQLKNVNITF